MDLEEITESFRLLSLFVILQTCFQSYLILTKLFVIKIAKRFFIIYHLKDACEGFESLRTTNCSDFFSKLKNYFFQTELFIFLTSLSLPEALSGISDLERVPGEWRELPSLSSPLLFVSIINEITTMD